MLIFRTQGDESFIRWDRTDGENVYNKIDVCKFISKIN